MSLAPLNRDSTHTSSGESSRHAVQFYESDQFLIRTLGTQVRAGLHGGERFLLVAEGDHWAALARHLTAHGVDLAAMRQSGRIVWADARETLARFMAGSAPDERQFGDWLASGPLVDAGGEPLRVYGEMVNLLLRDGSADAALRVEDLWNRHLPARSMSLLCAYSIGTFDGCPEVLEEVCGCHGRVVPTEDYTGIDDTERRQWKVVSLQLRARALTAEIRRRGQLEQTLQDALTDRERALERERAARGEAGTADRAKDQFLAVLSHELRTPLNAILGWAHLISTPAADPSRIALGLDVIRRNALLQARVIDDLLDVARIFAGQFPFRRDPVDLVDVVDDAVAQIQPVAAASGIYIRARIAVASALPVKGDGMRLQQALIHLLSNAITFSEEHGTVDVSLVRDGERARLTVEDNGQGIAPDFLPYVFDRFSQGEVGLARRHGGLGLGLTIVRHVIEAHGGTVWAASEGIGRGATFGVLLPIVPPGT